MHGQRITTCTPRASDPPSQKANGVEEVDPRSNFEGRGFGPHRNRSVIENLLGHPHGVLHSRAIVAETIIAGQERGLAAIVEGSRRRKLDFYITNNMCDETKLPFGKPVSKKCPCLAWHSQVTWADASGKIEDLDVSRPPP